MNFVYNARWSEVENSDATADSSEDCVVVKEIDLEETEISLCSFESF
jgi:hypothetical protein